MATIIRDGKPITLTADEIRSVLQDEHRTAVRLMYEDAVKECEAEEWISFDNWASVSFGNYSSEEDARRDFIETLTEDYIAREEIYDRDPDHFRSYHDYQEDVLDLAEDFEYNRT